MVTGQLYEKFLLLSRNSANFGSLDQPTVKAAEANPVCGDKVTLDLLISGRTITGAKYQGEGCLICLASAAVMADLLQGCSLDIAKSQLHDFQAMMSGSLRVSPHPEMSLLEEVKKYPVRVKCALLPWYALRTCLENYHGGPE